MNQQFEPAETAGEKVNDSFADLLRSDNEGAIIVKLTQSKTYILNISDENLRRSDDEEQTSQKESEANTVRLTQNISLQNLIVLPPMKSLKFPFPIYLIKTSPVKKLMNFLPHRLV